MVCIRCQKRPAIIFIQRMDNGQMKQEGYCLHCARELHIKPVDDLMKQFGMSDQDLDNMENRMESMMEEMGDANPLSMMMNMANGGEDADPDSMDEDLIPGSNATFPLGFTSSEKKDGDKKADRKNGKKPPKRKFLDTYCENLTRKAREGKLDDIIGRDREIYRTIQILSRRQKNNPCLIGEAGVGKTAIAEGIAERIAKGNVPIGLKDKEIYLLDLTSLVAGTQFRGQFEQRVKGLLSEVKAAGNVILFIDEIHTITSAGESEGAMNAGNILKPALSRGEIQVIGATTFNEYRKYIEKDQALERRFDPRKTRIGEIIRKTSIDELPQFINVFKGDMSIVGPRPHMLKHTQEYSQLINKFMVRHFVKPGITGWAQVTGYRGETKELWQMEGRVMRDIWYIEHWTFLLDLYIMYKTVYNAIHGEKEAY